ncbi:hypothetical protein AVEN_194574-1 [Araneus ventricosus]|uniref:Uncharacterized protein n=1 Tax=Araneus ventricosus TaxID=182803 RepID=A0A4Y2A737_ARAVE|nr:hypothetical protein AVEN_194574-1 [Araneus ventricosus]
MAFRKSQYVTDHSAPIYNQAIMNKKARFVPFHIHLCGGMDTLKPFPQQRRKPDLPSKTIPELEKGPFFSFFTCVILFDGMTSKKHLTEILEEEGRKNIPRSPMQRERIDQIESQVVEHNLWAVLLR